MQVSQRCERQSIKQHRRAALAASSHLERERGEHRARRGLPERIGDRRRIRDHGGGQQVMIVVVRAVVPEVPVRTARIERVQEYIPLRPIERLDKVTTRREAHDPIAALTQRRQQPQQGLGLARPGRAGHQQVRGLDATHQWHIGNAQGTHHVMGAHQAQQFRLLHHARAAQVPVTPGGASRSPYKESEQRQQHRPEHQRGDQTRHELAQLDTRHLSKHGGFGQLPHRRLDQAAIAPRQHGRPIGPWEQTRLQLGDGVANREPPLVRIRLL